MSFNIKTKKWSDSYCIHSDFSAHKGSYPLILWEFSDSTKSWIVFPISNKMRKQPSIWLTFSWHWRWSAETEEGGAVLETSEECRERRETTGPGLTLWWHQPWPGGCKPSSTCTRLLSGVLSPFVSVLCSLPVQSTVQLSCHILPNKTVSCPKYPRFNTELETIKRIFRAHQAGGELLSLCFLITRARHLAGVLTVKSAQKSDKEIKH